MSFTPTKNQLEDLGFIGDRITIGFCALRFSENGFDLLLPGVSKYVYPQSIEDIKTLIRYFTPPGA